MEVGGRGAAGSRAQSQPLVVESHVLNLTVYVQEILHDVALVEVFRDALLAVRPVKLVAVVQPQLFVAA